MPQPEQAQPEQAQSDQTQSEQTQPEQVPTAPKIAVVIPALNEAESLPGLLAAMPPIVTRVVVGDNGSTDATPERAAQAGAVVVRQPERGYGAACLAAIAWLEQHEPPDILVFLDADFADDPANLPALIAPILSNEVELSLANRRPLAEPGALSVPQRFGSWLAGGLIRLIWGAAFQDLGPFRAITWPAYQRLGMKDRNFGWTVEMQIKAAQLNLRWCEIALPYACRRKGRSKVSGNLWGSFRAGTKILYLILAAFFRQIWRSGSSS